MHNNSISNLLDLKDVFVKNIVHSADSVEIHVTTKAKPHICPSCSKYTSKVHDYRLQKVKDVPVLLKNTFIHIRKRRYVCSCGKKFYENFDFLPKYYRMTNRVIFSIFNELKENYSMASVAKRYNISTNTVSRIFDYASYSFSTMPRVLSIDEFKGNSGGSKYHCILVDAENRKVLDVIKDRKTSILSSYFSSFSRSNRLNVEYFITDMWRPYLDLARTYFKNSKIVIDKYHFTRINYWAIESVRKRIQKNMDPKLRKYYKRSKKLILARKENLDHDSLLELDIMILYNEDLRRAHHLKESFYEFTAAKSSEEARPLLNKWIQMAQNSGVKEYIYHSKTFINFKEEILNSFDVPYTNGPTEGFNNKIKVIKRNAFGYKNFERFRKRILHTTN